MQPVVEEGDQAVEARVDRLRHPETAAGLERGEAVQGGADGARGVDRVVAAEAVAREHGGEHAHRAGTGVAGEIGRALRAVATAYREYAREHPGSYAAAQRAAWVGDDAGARAVRVFTAVLAGYGLEGDAAIHATRGIRAALHGFAALEAGGGFGMPQSVDESFARLVTALDRGLQG